MFFLEMNKILMWIMYAFSLGSLLPYLGVAIRRLHDSNKSAWYVLLPIVPSIVSRLEGLEWFGIVSLVISILLFSLPSDLKKNPETAKKTVKKKTKKVKTKVKAKTKKKIKKRTKKRKK